MNRLFLTLSKKPFEVMHTEEKQREFRKPSKWIKTRLYNKDGSKKEYELIVFRNGYRGDMPVFICKYEGFEISQVNETIRYSNDLQVVVEKGDLIIKLGKIIYKGNIAFK